MKQTPILITGSHRSGTTWVGRMLALSPAVVYVDEPFNIQRAKPIFHYWFTHLTPENEQPYYHEIKGIIQFRYSLMEALRDIRSGLSLTNAVSNYIRFWRHRRQENVPLLKDPIAVLSAEWLHEKFDMRVVTLIRHPAAFAGSLKKKGWTHPFSHFLQQSTLMKKHLQPFEPEIRDFARHQRDTVEQACLLWKIIYSVVCEYRQRHPDWIFVRHEDIANAPLQHFAQLYRELSLDFTEEIQETIRAYSSSRNPRDEVDDNHRIMRDSRSVIQNWKSRLTSDEVARVKRSTSPYWQAFYEAHEW